MSEGSPEFEQPAPPDEEVQSPTIEEDDSSPRKSKRPSIPFIPGYVHENIAESRHEETRPQSIKDFDN